MDLDADLSCDRFRIAKHRVVSYFVAGNRIVWKRVAIGGRPKWLKCESNFTVSNTPAFVQTEFVTVAYAMYRESQEAR